MTTSRPSILFSMIWLLFLFVPALAQEEGDFSYPPEIGIPPEPPANDCECKFMAYIQPSQGVLQDDPRDSNFLELLRGPSTLAEAMPGSPLLFAFRLPTFRARLDMVVGRDTYLLSANPYEPAQAVQTPIGDAYPMAVQNFTKLTFKGTTKFTVPVPVDVRVTVLHNGLRIKQFLSNTSPLFINLAGPCGAEKPLNVSSDLLEKSPRSSLKFQFNAPGNYQARAELVYHDANQTDLTKLRPTGLAVDIYGKAITTKTPSLAFISLLNDGVTGNAEQAFVNFVKTAATNVGKEIQDYLAIPSKNVTPPTSPVNLRASLFTGMVDAALQFSAARRQSNVNKRPDRLVVMVEDQVFQRLLDSSFASNPANYSSGALSVAISKDIIIIRGPKRAASPTALIQYFYPFGRAASPENLIHRSLLSSFGFLWEPEAGKMGDCKVDPYHETNSKIAYGLALRQPGGATTYAVQKDLMEFYPKGVVPNLCQCTYRHGLEALSKTAIDPPMLQVSGTITNQGLLSMDAILNPLYQVDGFPELSQQGPGKFAIVLKDQFDQVIAEYPFSANFQTSAGTLKETSFDYTVDLPTGLARVEITEPVYYIGGTGRRVLDAIDLSQYPPYIFNFTKSYAINGAEYSWQGYDFDGDPIVYSLYASEDGEVFYPTGVFETTRTNAFLSLSPTVKFLKLVATDGGRSSSTIMSL